MRLSFSCWARCLIPTPSPFRLSNLSRIRCMDGTTSSSSSFSLRRRSSVSAHPFTQVTLVKVRFSPQVTACAPSTKSGSPSLVGTLPLVGLPTTSNGSVTKLHEPRSNPVAQTYKGDTSINRSTITIDGIIWMGPGRTDTKYRLRVSLLSSCGAGCGIGASR